MKLKRKQVNKVLRVLYDAKPEYASLVKHGANETAFTEVKGVEEIDRKDERWYKEVEESMKLKTVLSEANTNEEEILSLKGSNVVHKLVFDKKEFKTEKSVNEYASKKYEDYEVVEKDNSFEIINRPESDFTETKSIPLFEQGVNAVVGYLPDEESVEKTSGKKKPKYKEDEKQEETETKKESSKYVEILKSHELVQKLDTYASRWEGTKTISDGIAVGNDGLPLGIYEINDIFYNSLRNIVKDGDSEKAEIMSGIDGLVAEFGDYIKILVELTYKAGMTMEQKEALFVKKEAEKSEEVKTEKSANEKEITSTKSEEVETSKDKDVVEVDSKKSTEAKEEADSETSQKSATDLGNFKEILAESLGNMQETILKAVDTKIEASIQKSTEDNQEVVKSKEVELEEAQTALKEAESVAETAKKRVEELESITKSSKGLSQDEAAIKKSADAEVTVSKEDEAYDHKVMKDILGF